MDQIIKGIERLCIEDLVYKTLFAKPMNIQKCYVSNNLFSYFGVTPGTTFVIQYNDKAYLCKLFPKTIRDNLVEFDWSVEVRLKEKNRFLCSKNENNSIFPDQIYNLSQFQKAPDTIALQEIHINIVFDQWQSIDLWSNRDEELSIFIKYYLLNFYTITNDCIISLTNLPETQRMGIHKLIIVPNQIECVHSILKLFTNTKIVIGDRTSKFQYDQMNLTITPLFAMENIEERLLEIIKMNESFSKNESSKHFPPTKQVLIVGPSGCGKSSLVRIVAQKTNCTMVSILGHEINQCEPGETELALRNLFDQAFKYAKYSGKCIINMEEMDNLCPQRGSSGSHIQRAVSQLLILLDKAQTIPGIMIMATTNKPELLDTSVRRHGRLETEIYIGPPTENQREIILSHLIEDLCLNISEEKKRSLSQSVATMTPGYVGADLKLLCQTISWKLYKEQFNDEHNTFEFWFNEFRKVILNMTPASLKGTLGVVTTKHTLFSELAGLETIKKSLEMSIIWPIKHSQAFRRLGISRPRGVLLYGPPGCAKTSLVRALASLGTFSLLSISAAELYSPYVGDAERLIAQLFQRARQNSPCILFIDEIDALAGSRGNSTENKLDIQERIIASLLTQMDGVGHRLITADYSDLNATNSDDGVIVIGATNRPEMVDNALLRPGRFDKHIHVPPPNYKGRVDILKLITSKMPLADDVDLLDIASKTELYSGADIKNICTEAAMLAMSMEGMDIGIIKNMYFLQTLKRSRPSLNSHQVKKYYDFEYNKL